MNDNFFQYGKLIVIGGVVLILVGLALMYLPGFGRLPGDIVVRKKNFTFYFPVVTSILLSLLLSLLLYFFNRSK